MKWTIALLTLIFVGLPTSAHANEPASGQQLASCWMEGTSVKCQRYPSANVTAKLTMEFVNYSKTVDSSIDCCGIDAMSPDLSERTDCTACDVRNITTFPAQAFPVKVTLTATYNGQSWSQTIEVAAENAFTAAAPLQIVLP